MRWNVDYILHVYCIDILHVYSIDEDYHITKLCNTFNISIIRNVEFY